MESNRKYFANVSSYSLFLVCILQEKGNKINFEYWKYALVISLPMLVHTILLNLLTTTDRVIITKYVEQMTLEYMLGY